ncbi:hypothetical protein Pelo_2324 [Pelomyxa schiedti]|nr:hypothetical protein Pelo_2324 [Pelomyxa schiedti]
MATSSTTTTSSTPTTGGGKKDHKVIGTLSVTVCEVRNVSCGWVTCDCEYTIKSTARKKNSKNTQFTDSPFQFGVQRENAMLVINANKKSLFGESVSGYSNIPVAEIIKAGTPVSQWYRLEKPSKAKVTNSVLPTQSEGGPKKGEGEVRLQISFEAAPPEKIPVKGIAIDAEFSELLSGGNIISNPRWYNNPQFLLTVLKPCDIEIICHQPPCEEQISFYILRYDNDFYKGRRKTAFQIDEIFKVEHGSALCPTHSHDVQVKENLPAGTYCVIPCSQSRNGSEGRPHRGKFTIMAYTDPIDTLSFTQLPLESWNCASIVSEWTEENCGGADITGATWMKNPQFLLTLTKRTDIAIQLNQPEDEASMGIYVISTEDPTKKAVWYRDTVGSTQECQAVCSVGANLKRNKPGTYIIIPVTHEERRASKFDLHVFSDDPAATLTALTSEWRHSRSSKSKWAEGTAGGAPNQETFSTNPQFLCHVEPVEGEVLGSDKAEVLVQLTQITSKSQRTLTSVGLAFFTRDKTDEGRLQPDELCKARLMKPPEGHSVLQTVFDKFRVPANEETFFVIVPSTFEPEVHMSFKVTVYSDLRVHLTELLDEEGEESS